MFDSARRWSNIFSTSKTISIGTEAISTFERKETSIIAGILGSRVLW